MPTVAVVAERPPIQLEAYISLNGSEPEVRILLVKQLEPLRTQ